MKRVFLAGTGIAGIGGLVWYLFFSLGSPFPWVRVAAVARLTNQAALTKVATGDGYSYVRKAAVAKLTDQPTLGGIAANDLDRDVQEEALAKLSDQVALVKIATSDGVVVSWNAVGKLTVEGLLSEASRGNDPQKRALFRVVAKFLLAGNHIPTSNEGKVGFPVSNRNRIVADLLPLAVRYADPLWVSRFGALKDVSIRWTTTGASYYGGNGFDGEVIDFTAAFEGTQAGRTLSARWTTNFPRLARFAPGGYAVSFLTANIDIADAYIPWLAADQEALAQAAHDPNFHVRSQAVAKLTNHTLLATVAAKDPIDDVRAAAVKRLRELDESHPRDDLR
jgi:hypothetical protein